MLRTRLLTATAAIALFTAGSSFAQDMTSPATPPQTTPATPAEPVTPAQTMPATPAVPAQTTAAATPAAANTVVDVLRANGQFTTLLTALDAAQLTETLNTQAAISIFAPTDAAFAALPEADRTRLMDPANVNELRQLLLYHVVVADVNSSQIEGAKGGVRTAANTEVQLDGTGDAIKVDNATVTTADLDASNGAVFVIDRVLNPAESQVATGDAEATPAPAEGATEATPPADDTAVAAPPVTDDTTTDEDAGATTGTDEATTPPTAPAAAPMTAAPAPATPSTTTTRPATGVNAPNGQPASTVTTTASPTVPNPTDGQTDDADDGDAAMAPTTTTTAPAPRPQS